MLDGYLLSEERSTKWTKNTRYCPKDRQIVGMNNAKFEWVT